VTHHEGLERGVELADPRPGTRRSGHDVLLRVAAVADQLLELLDARLLDVRGLLQVLNLPIHGGAVGLGEARVLRLGDLLGGLGLLGVVGDGVGDRSVLDRVGLSLGIGGDGVHVDGGVVLGGGHRREKVTEIWTRAVGSSLPRSVWSVSGERGLSLRRVGASWKTGAVVRGKTCARLCRRDASDGDLEVTSHHQSVVFRDSLVPAAIAHRRTPA